MAHRPGAGSLVGVSGTPQWFEGEVDGGPDADSFLARVRELAPAALGERVTADHTSTSPDSILGIDLPGVDPWPRCTNHLQVTWEDEVLGGSWGNTYSWGEYDPDDADVLYVDEELTPQEAAERAVEWLAAQLRRPLVRQEWDRRWSSTPLQRWVLSDNDHWVAGTSRRPWRRRPPDRTMSFRPGSG